MTDVRIQIEHGWCRVEVHEDRPPRIKVGGSGLPDQLTDALVSAIERASAAAHLDLAEIGTALVEIARDEAIKHEPVDVPPAKGA